MSKKITPNRNYLKGLDGKNIPAKRNYTDEEAMKRYFKQFNKTHYRTIGIKFNIVKEKDILAWLDYQPTLKPYITGLIVADMEKEDNKQRLAEAKQFYEDCESGIITTSDIPNYPKKKLSDVLMKCECCGADAMVSAQAYIKRARTKTKFVCLKCGGVMEPINQPDLTEEELNEAELELNRN